MKFKRISIIPIEFLTDKKREKYENYLVNKKLITKISIKKSNEYNIFQEISSGYSKFYQVKDNIKILFTESSCCIIFEEIKNNWTINIKHITNELKYRNQLHKDIIKNNKNSPINNLISIIKEKQIYTDFLLDINYVFSFYIINITKKISRNEEMLLMYLVEPSLIDLDDMLTSNVDNCNINFNFEKQNYKILKDYDVSTFSKTFMSWATIVSIIHNEPFKDKTESLLKALEVKLQSVWNRCYTLEKYIDNIIVNNASFKEADNVYWNFSRTLDDASRVLTSTLSTRADKLFKEMVATSSLEIEIKRLQDRFVFLEKYINKQNQKINRKFSIIFELLLFLTALSSIGQLLFPLPIIKNTLIGWGIIILIMSIGSISIIQTKK